jgi:hypothetical protein
MSNIFVHFDIVVSSSASKLAEAKCTALAKTNWLLIASVSAICRWRDFPRLARFHPPWWISATVSTASTSISSLVRNDRQWCRDHHADWDHSKFDVGIYIKH